MTYQLWPEWHKGVSYVKVWGQREDIKGIARAEIQQWHHQSLVCIRETNAPDWLESRANHRVSNTEYRETERLYEDSFSHGQELKLYSNKKALESLEWEECEKYNFGFKDISVCAYGRWIVEGQTWKQKDQLIAYTTNLRKTWWWLGPRWWKWRKGGVDGLGKKKIFNK